MNKRGVSLISLVITIIVIIILASISLNSMNTIDETSNSKVMQELSEVKKGMLVVRSINAKSGIDEDTLNKGFIKVKVENPPDNFVSYDTDESTGYVVDLSVIDYEKLKSGQDYSKLSSGDTITFNESDVYVYDASLKVFYAKNGKYLDGYGSDENNTSTRLNGPTIQVISTKDGNLHIEVTPAYGGNILSVLVDGQKATTTDGKNFEYVVKSKESCTIIANEEGGSSTTKVVRIENGTNDNDNDIDSPKIISYVCNYKQGTADVTVIAQDNNSKIVSYAVTVGEDVVPSSDSWVSITEPANKYTAKFNVTENGVYTVWVKNSFGKIGNASKSIRVMLNVKYKYDANGGESVNIAETTVQIGCNSFVDLTPKASRRHYEFLGWNTKITATEGLTIYNIGTENDLVLYAIFRPKIKLTKPTIAVPTYTYNGQVQTLQLNNFDSAILDITDNTMIDVGTKTAIVRILNKDRYEWADGTDDEISYTWSIDKKKITTVWGNTRLFTYNGSEQAPTATADSGVTGETLNLVRTTAVNTGNYTSSASIASVTGGQAKVENYELQNTTVDFRIQNADMSGSIKITGDNVYLKTLTADTSGIVPTGCTLKYQWYSSTKNAISGGTAISGATSSTYIIPKNMIGKYIYVVVSATKANYNSKKFVDNTDSTNNKSAITICEHTWKAATCTTPKTCTKCGATTGGALGHNYSAATCTTPATCTRCGVTTGGALGHNYSAATCTTPATCTRCGATNGGALGHSFSSATCTRAATCTRCGATSGTALGHSYRSATCTAPKKCSRCGATSGPALGHKWSSKWSGNMTSHWKQCIRCSATKDAGVHKVPYGSTKCSICGKKALGTDAT